MRITVVNPLGLGPLANAERWIRALTVWQTLLTVAGLGSIGLGIAGQVGPDAGLGRTATTAALSIFTVACAASVALLVAGRHAGRTLALTTNYIAFVVCLFLLLQVSRVFVGLDALGATFHRGVPFLLVSALGYIATGIGDGTGRSATIQRTGRVVLALGVIGLLLAVGLLPGIATFISRLGRPLALGLLVASLTFGMVAARTYRPDVARRYRATTGQQRALDGMLFVSPNLLGFLAFFAGPLLFSLFVSLNEWDAFGTQEWVGFSNYSQLLALDVARIGEGERAAGALAAGYREVVTFAGWVIGARDPLFWRSLFNIVKFSVLAIPLAVIPALFLATLLNSRAPGIKIFRALYFVPSVAGVVAVALIWRQLFNSTVGWINYLLSRATALWNALPLLPETSPPQPQWLSDSDIALYSLVIVFAWQYLGFNTVLFLAGLQGIDGTLYEAAMIDGANRWQRFRNVTLPQLAPTTFFVVASTGILALQLFGENVVLFPTTTPIGAGPVNSTMTPVVYLYEMGFRRFAQGYASAVAWLLFLLIFAFTFIQFRRQRAQTEGS